MDKLVQLKREAREACLSRGHDMKRFQGIPFWSHDRIQVAECRNCKRKVLVNTYPMPNEIDIGGEAVAVDCR